MGSARRGEGIVNFLRAALFFITTLLIYLGVPLLGWGLLDVRGFLSEAARLGYAVCVAGFALAVAIQALAGQEGIRGGAGQDDRRVRRQTVVRFAMSLGLFGALFFLPYADRRGLALIGLGPAARWVGVILAGLGYLLVYWSGLALGRQYSPEVTIQKDHQLINGGPYRTVRHPRYLGVLLLALGASLLFRSWIGLTGCVPLLGILLSRIADEERLLHQEFGEAWEAYRARSWRLIPYLY